MQTAAANGIGPGIVTWETGFALIGLGDSACVAIGRIRTAYRARKLCLLVVVNHLYKNGCADLKAFCRGGRYGS
jgi:hypothetical protein